MANQTNIIEYLCSENYKSWNRYSVLGVDIELASMPSDIPLLKYNLYNPLSDTLRVEFYTKREARKICLNDYISVLEDDNGQIEGMYIYGIKTVGESLTIIIKNSLDSLIERKKSVLNNLTDRVEAYRELGKFDRNFRRINLIKDIAQASLERLKFQ